MAFWGVQWKEEGPGQGVSTNDCVCPWEWLSTAKAAAAKAAAKGAEKAAAQKQQKKQQNDNDNDTFE